MKSRHIKFKKKKKKKKKTSKLKSVETKNDNTSSHRMVAPPKKTTVNEKKTNNMLIPPPPKPSIVNIPEGKDAFDAFDAFNEKSGMYPDQKKDKYSCQDLRTEHFPLIREIIEKHNRTKHRRRRYRKTKYQHLEKDGSVSLDYINKILLQFHNIRPKNIIKLIRKRKSKFLEVFHGQKRNQWRIRVLRSKSNNSVDLTEKEPEKTITGIKRKRNDSENIEDENKNEIGSIRKKRKIDDEKQIGNKVNDKNFESGERKNFGNRIGWKNKSGGNQRSGGGRGRFTGFRGRRKFHAKWKN